MIIASYLCQEMIRMYAYIVPYPTMKPRALPNHCRFRSLSDIFDIKLLIL